MDDKTQQSKPAIETPPKKKKNGVGFGIKLSEWAISGVLGLTSGLFASVHKVHDLFRDDSKKATAFQAHYHGVEPDAWLEQVKARFDAKYKEYAQGKGELSKEEWFSSQKEAFDKELDARPIGRQARLDQIELKAFRERGESGADYRRAIREEKRLIEDEYKELAFKFRDIPKGFVKSTIAKFELMSPSSKGVLAFNGAIGAFVGAAMTVSFFNGVATREKIERIDEAVQSDLENQPDDQKPLAFKDRQPLPPKALEKNDDKTTAHAKKVAAEAATGKPVKDLREKHEELKEERPVSHVERVGEPVKQEHVGKPASHVEKLAAAADAQDLQVAAR